MPKIVAGARASLVAALLAAGACGAEPAARTPRVSEPSATSPTSEGPPSIETSPAPSPSIETPPSAGAPTAPSEPLASAPAPAPDPCARYFDASTITCSAPGLTISNDCHSSANATTEDAVRAHQAKMKRCYQAELSRDVRDAPHGEIVLQGSVDANGCVLTARPFRADPSYPKSLLACLARGYGALDKIPKGVAVTTREITLSTP